MSSDDTTTGRLLWQVTTRWRAAVDRAVASLGLTHAQYTLLGSLYGLSRSGTRPSQRELADFAGLEPIYVSKLVRALEGAGLVVRTEHPTDPRALQLTLTDQGTAVIREAVTVVHALQEELTAPIGGIAGPRNRDLIRTLQALLHPSDRSEKMTKTQVLTGQDISEAHGAVRKLHEQILHGSGTTSNEQITLRVVAVRGPWTTRTALRDYLQDQPQLALDQSAADRLLDSLEQRGLITTDTPVVLTAQGKDLLDRLTATVQGTAARLYDGLSPDDLAVAQRVLTKVTEQAEHLRRQL
ncbi:MarR family transcriptional regulator [Actinomadura sp. 6K520]|uniref:MarR family winged helix-turn-helix transcriptional regulator n=1 Tax=Actinomadura sp. 6K520 TaxID=2530364 RepID=UPI0010472E7B|nr:MarR family transcriptional regulator [Actinomadura sp. 6K520]TDE33222.1 MarR family transcriptional regulator [Actinomadura sp. 6K520]